MTADTVGDTRRPLRRVRTAPVRKTVTVAKPASGYSRRTTFSPLAIPMPFTACHRLIRLFLASVMLACTVHASAGAGTPADGNAPTWSDEAPVLARLLEEGYRAESRRQPQQAAARYCTAARSGSVEGQYRLGRLLLQNPGMAHRRASAHSVLALAARQGHERAGALLAQHGGGMTDTLPDCLLSDDETALADAESVVPHDVVDRFVESLAGDRRSHARLIQRLAPRFRVDPRLALAIARTESNFNAAARSPKNAQGLMQLIPETAARFGVRDAMDPEQNVRGGLAYLHWLLERFDGDVVLAAAAYNAGEGAVARFSGVPPYAETQEYVRRIMAFYRTSRHQPPLAHSAADGLAGKS